MSRLTANFRQSKSIDHEARDRLTGISILLFVPEAKPYLRILLETLLSMADQVCLVIDYNDTDLVDSLRGFAKRWGEERITLLFSADPLKNLCDPFDPLARAELLRLHNAALSRVRYQIIWYWSIDLLPLVRRCQLKLERLRASPGWQYFLPMPTLSQAFGWREKLGIALYRNLPFSEFAFWDSLKLTSDGVLIPTGDLRVRRYGLWQLSPLNIFRLEAKQIIPEIENLKHHYLGADIVDLSLSELWVGDEQLREIAYGDYHEEIS
ncbi:MAG: hypothetical protein SFT81_04110 [Candidatus Caenarcaniphilales bacterium]|nr:hypothetical protein [Candidatus Caenarcaniphilales bacterium]